MARAMRVAPSSKDGFWGGPEQRDLWESQHIRRKQRRKTQRKGTRESSN